MLVELSSDDISNLLNIINKATITGAGADAVVELKQKIQTPAKPEKKE